MGPIKLDGKVLSDRICGDLKKRCNILQKSGMHPHLTIVTTTSDSANATYIRNKVRRCEEIGIETNIQRLDRLTRYNLREVCKEQTPIILQMPMNTGEDVTPKILNDYVNSWIDVDGFLNMESTR